MQTLTSHEKLGLQNELTHYEDKVNDAKNFATSQMFYLCRMLDRVAERGPKHKGKKCVSSSLDLTTRTDPKY